MADKDFVVKNGLQVNGGTWVVNSTAIYFNGSQVINSTAYVGTANTATTALTANNSTNLGGVGSGSYVNTSGNYTLSGNLNITSSNTVFSSGWKVGANIVADTTSINFGNTTVNAVVNSTGLYVNGALFVSGSGAGYYKGNAGAIGNTSNKENLYRINSNTQSNNITISTGENALTVGPIVVSSGFSLIIETGARAVII